MQGKGISDLGRTEQLTRLKRFLDESFVVQDQTYDQVQYLREHAPKALQPTWIEHVTLMVLLTGLVLSPFIFFIGCVEHVGNGNGWIIWLPALAVIVVAWIIRKIAQKIFLTRRYEMAEKALGTDRWSHKVDWYIREGTIGKDIESPEEIKVKWETLIDVIQKVIVHPHLQKQLLELVPSLLNISREDHLPELKDELYEIIKRGSYYHDMAAWEQKEVDILLEQFQDHVRQESEIQHVPKNIKHSFTQKQQLQS